MQSVKTLRELCDGSARLGACPSPTLPRRLGGVSLSDDRAGLGGKSKDGGDSSSGAGSGSSSGGSGSGGQSGARSGSEDALVPSGPERKHHKVFVVELSRKPLFPGIYTPVMINKNEALVKEILEVKKQG
jgi:Lon-like ATP-dependent protease